jgi:hypothetical protein
VKIREEISIQKRYLVVDATCSWRFVFSDGQGVTWFQGRYEIDLYKYVADSRSIQRPYIEWDDKAGTVLWQVSDVSVGELSGVNGQLVSISNPSLDVKVISVPDVLNVKVISVPDVLNVNLGSVSQGLAVPVKGTGVGSIRQYFSGLGAPAMWDYFLQNRDALGYSIGTYAVGVRLCGQWVSGDMSVYYDVCGVYALLNSTTLTGVCKSVTSSGVVNGDVKFYFQSEFFFADMEVEFFSKVSYQ